MKETKRTKRYLKRVVESGLTNINIIIIMLIMFTIETLNKPFNQITIYLICLVVGIIILIVNTIILIKYGKNFQELFEEE